MITIKAGPNGTPFTAHKDLVCKLCPVFRAAFNGPMIEGETQTYILEDNTPACIRSLVKWFYSSSLDHLEQVAFRKLRSPGPGPVGKTRAIIKSPKPAEDMLLCELYVLADKLLIPRLCNQIINEIEELRFFYKVTPTKCLEYVYENTAEDSPLRRLMVQQCAFHVPAEWYEEKPAHFPKDFLLDLTQTLLSEIPAARVADVARVRRSMRDFEVDDEAE